VPDDFQAPGVEAPRYERTRFERPQFDRPRTAGAFGRPDRPRFGDGPSDRFAPLDRTRRQGIPIRPAVIADPSLALGDDEELVAGRRPVEEAFVARREAIKLLVVPQRRMALEKLVLHATSLRIPVVEVEGGTLTAIAGFDGHQGIALVVAPRRWAAPDDLLAHALAAGRAPLVLVLDSLEDPQNVGTLLRTAEASGVDGAVFPTRNQAPLTPAAVKASAGAVEHLLLAPVDDLPGALADLHARGLRIVGADGEAQLTAREADLRGPIAIVVGSEGKGLGPAVRRRCDLLIRIPMHGKIESLNASVAGSILLYEAAAQRRLPENPPTVPDAGRVEPVTSAMLAQDAETPAEPAAEVVPAVKRKTVRRKAAPAAPAVDAATDPTAESVPDDAELLP
jgi:23S rRNA (guanosine2251-2'-O)-methyltransferase